MRRLFFVIFILTVTCHGASLWGLDENGPSKPAYDTSHNAFDPNMATEGKYKTNAERTQHGLAPIGRDGKPVEIHHQDRKNDGTRVEVTHSEHVAIHRQEPKKRTAQPFGDRSQSLQERGPRALERASR